MPGMDDERLIKLVERHELLYSKYNKESKSFAKKDAAWQEIANALGASKSDCIQRWTHLRNRYTKESRRMKMLQQSGMQTTFWPVFNALAFLNSHIIPRRKRITLRSLYEKEHTSQHFPADEQEHLSSFKNVSEKFEVESIPSLASEEESNDFMIKDETVSTVMPQYDMQNVKKMEETNVLGAPQSTLSSSSLPSRQINDRLPFYESDIDKDLKRIAIEVLTLVRDTTQSRHKNPAVHGFGQMIVETICSMNEKKQAIAMQKMTEIAMKLKMEPDN